MSRSFLILAFSHVKAHNPLKEEMSMAKKWTDFTRREKIIGVLVAVFAVVSIGGISSAMNGGQTQTQNTTPAPQVASPVVTYKDLEETETIPFLKETKNDDSRNSGTSEVTTIGVTGIKTKTYKITLTDGIESNRELKSEVVTTPPINEVISIGTYVAPVKKATSSNCDPNYSGACVPIASDVDCAGGSGNGPAYTSGPVKVIGSDIYDLDRDGNGIGCES